jgi:hypothetical protein
MIKFSILYTIYLNDIVDLSAGKEPNLNLVGRIVAAFWVIVCGFKPTRPGLTDLIGSPNRTLHGEDFVQYLH